MQWDTLGANSKTTGSSNANTPHSDTPETLNSKTQSYSLSKPSRSISADAPLVVTPDGKRVNITQDTTSVDIQAGSPLLHPADQDSQGVRYTRIDED